MRKAKRAKRATTKASTRKGASTKASKPKAKTANIRSNPIYKQGFEAGKKAGMKARPNGKTAEANA